MIISIIIGDIQIRNFNDNPIPDFYVGVVDKVGD